MLVLFKVADSGILPFYCSEKSAQRGSIANNEDLLCRSFQSLRLRKNGEKRPRRKLLGLSSRLFGSGKYMLSALV